MLASLTRPLQEGMKVSARFKEGRAWFPGEVTALHLDGPKVEAEILYDDGRIEGRVQREMIRAPGGYKKTVANTVADRNRRHEEATKRLEMERKEHEREKERRKVDLRRAIDRPSP